MNALEFKSFVSQHRGRHPGAKLPDFDAATVMYGSWLKVLLRRGVTDVKALEDASVLLLTKPPPRHLDHFPTLCGLAESCMKARGAKVPADVSTREGAEAASKRCDRCGGCGLALVFHPAPDRERKIPPQVSAYCVCAMGRWIERNHRERSPDIRKRIPDLADVLAGRTAYLPGDNDGADSWD